MQKDWPVGGFFSRKFRTMNSTLLTRAHANYLQKLNNFSLKRPTLPYCLMSSITCSNLENEIYFGREKLNWSGTKVGRYLSPISIADAVWLRVLESYCSHDQISHSLLWYLQYYFLENWSSNWPPQCQQCARQYRILIPWVVRWEGFWRGLGWWQPCFVFASISVQTPFVPPSPMACTSDRSVTISFDHKYWKLFEKMQLCQGYCVVTKGTYTHTMYVWILSFLQSTVCNPLCYLPCTIVNRHFLKTRSMVHSRIERSLKIFETILSMPSCRASKTK